MKRLFIALPVDTGSLPMLLSNYKQLDGSNSILKLVELQNYHITLKFFGNCESEKAVDIERGFESLKIQSPEVPFTLHGMGAFPNIKRAGVIWYGLKINSGIINSLYNTIEEFAHKLGFAKEERGFKPHLTIARVRKGKRLPQDLTDFIIKNKEINFGESCFKKIVLYSSTLTPGGPIYKELKTISLASA